MARAGEAPPALYQGLPYGANALVNDMSEDIPDDDEFVDDDFDEIGDFQPVDDDEAFLFSPTDRPDEPITAGLPFGDGPNMPISAIRGETKQDFALRVANELTALGGSVKGVQQFADRIAKGL